ncbi:MAG: hypothetical protein J5985_08830 [Kiritimatiellae bacterium]|nr:hypothetical protein [Kiritimatiellia bacterium]
MKPIDLLQSLETFNRLSPREILAHPAWRLATTWGERAATLTAGGIRPDAVLDLNIRFGREVSVLGLAPSPAFPDFANLFEQRGEMPSAVLLAVVEKEFGPLFQLLENAVRQELAVDGLAADPSDGERICFTVTGGDGGQIATFTLAPIPALLAAFGDLRSLDCSHTSIARMPLAAEIEYAVFDLSPEEEAGLAPGDCLVLPEMASEKPGRIVLAGRGDPERLRVVAAKPADVTFADFAVDGELRCAPAGTGDLLLVKDGKRLASGRLGRLGEQPVLQLEALC